MAVSYEKAVPSISSYGSNRTVNPLESVEKSFWRFREYNYGGLSNRFIISDSHSRLRGIVLDLSKYTAFRVISHV